MQTVEYIGSGYVNYNISVKKYCHVKSTLTHTLEKRSKFDIMD